MNNTKKIVLAGGCFWGVEKYFSLIKGVLSTETGYANGNIKNPTYEQVCNENTNHAEVIAIEYDNDIISLEQLLLYYYDIIDPTSLNKQGNDQGTQYRTGIYFIDPSDGVIIQESLKKLQLSHTKPIVIECEVLKNYTKAEDEHQHYLDKNPAGYCRIPKSSFDKAKNTQHS